MPERDFPILQRLWIYQAERFPVFKHGILIAAFSSSGVCLSALLRGHVGFPDIGAFLVSFIVLFTLFFQLRIADEFKDAGDDAALRPQRPVPRGLISLKELAAVGVCAGLCQIVSIFIYSPALFPFLLAVWIYMGLMSAEFFVSVWLKSKPLLYMASHMLIMPLIDLFATACDWKAKGQPVPAGLAWFLIVSFFNGVILELGRKTWAPAMEIVGVESYSLAWGLRRALMAWGGAVLLSLFCAMNIALKIDFTGVAGVVLGLMVVGMIATGWLFYKNPETRFAARLESVSGLWIICIYLFLGIVPMAVKIWL